MGGGLYALYADDDTSLWLKQTKDTLTPEHKQCARTGALGD